MATAIYKVDKLIFIRGEFNIMSLGLLFTLRMGVNKPIIIYRGASDVYNQVYFINKAKA